ncbi:Telomere-associated protein RIF1 [Frankliniella fusca]|uniref:Telomere-associated protein RIF1 n=1 Tax=Frankliniella fusca TaxID=407009 RepID=A0AAE1HTI0_9NEOP|nr:Telomere-associated protein RIF1 [Frankliniella fusca]
MKEKDGNNTEDILAQISNSRTSETVLKSLYQKLNCDTLTNLQRIRALKLVSLHATKDGCTSDLQATALKSGLSILKADQSASTNSATGALLNFLEVCYKIVKDFVLKPSDLATDSVAIALEVLSLMNAMTASKMFSDNESELLSNLLVCLKEDLLKLPALSLLAVYLSEASTKSALKDEPLIQSIYPLLFNLEDSKIRSAALSVLRKSVLKSKTLPFWSQLKEDTQRIYCKQMVEMVNQKMNWPEIWQFVVKMFGEELHSGGQLINHMLEVLERAFKHADFEWTRVQAFVCWNTLIDNFKNGLRNKKRIDLIMIPLKANNHRIEILASAKLDTYNHLLNSLGKDLGTYPDVLLSFFSFCFGSEKVTCPPVKSYPALHEKCVNSINNIFASPLIKDVFTKIHKELIQAVGECFMLENVNSEVLGTLWDSLMGLIHQQEGTDIVKELFNVVNSLVSRAAIGETSANFKMRRSISPPVSPQGPRPLNIDLGRRIVLIVIHGLVEGRSALPANLFQNRTLYMGSFDVMNGTPPLLFVEWLLSPALRLGAGSTLVYKQLLCKIISYRQDGSTGFMDFVQQVLKKLPVIDESCSAARGILLYKSMAENWCILANAVVEYLQNQGSINQGDAAEHDFRAFYSLLMFPIQSLHVDFELVKECILPWKHLFYESCQQAALTPTTSTQELCEEVCTRLVSFSKRNSPPKQIASVFFFITNILGVAIEKFNSLKRVKWILKHISGVLKELNHVSFDQAQVFSQTAICIQKCLHRSSVTKEIINNISPTLCSLLKAKVNAPEPVDDLCSALSALKQASMVIHQHGMSENDVSSMLQNVILAGKNHLNEKIRASVQQLSNFSRDTSSPEKDKTVSHVNGSALESRLTSPKSICKKLSTVLMSPSCLSPGNSKEKSHISSCGSDAKFVRIETPPKKLILTEHQKEVRRERRQDIPALYQDLSQTSQSMTQDLTQDHSGLTSPKKKHTSMTIIEEDAVMDTGDIEPNIQVNFAKAESPMSTKKSKVESECNLNGRSFTPPAGFVLPITAENIISKSETKSITSECSGMKNADGTGKESEDSSTPSKVDKRANKTTRAITRSNSHTNLMTRSGKVVKRASLSLASEPDLLKKKKSARKSLPITSEEIVKKNSIETAFVDLDSTDTESTSSITSDVSSSAPKSGKKLGSKRRRSLKRDLSQELTKDSEKKSDGVERVSDAAVDKNEKNEEVSPVEKLKKSIQDVSQIKAGRKVLPRSCSNSSLDELGNTNTSKNAIELSCSETPNRAMSQSSEAENPLKQSPSNISCQSPRENGLIVSVENKNVDSMESRLEDESASGIIRNTRNKSTASPVPPVTSKPSSPQILLLVCNESPKSASPKNDENVQSRTSNKTEFKFPGSCKGSDESKQSNATDVKSSSFESKDENNLLDHSSQESQEVIESSQEPMSKMKQCVVSLELFRCADPNEKMEFEDVIVERGPERNSPYKVLPKTDNEISPTSKQVCRSLNMDDVDSVSLVALKKRVSTLLDKGNSAETELKNTECVVNPVETLLSPKKVSVSSTIEVKETSKMLNHPEEEKKQEVTSLGESLPSSRNSSMPEWMHEKKSSPPSKPLRTVRSACSRSQAFLKSVSPPKATDVSPMSSPVQSKRIQKTESTNSTPIIQRSSRAAQLLGLGQAAAARGGDTVVCNGNRSNRSEGEEVEISISATSSASSFNSIASSVCTSAINTSVNTVPVVGSPSVRRQGKLFEMVTPQKSLEDEGLRKDWVRKTPCAKATPDSSILKRKREADSDAASPSLKRKRVSFRDPPLSSILRFGETTEMPGTVISSDPCHYSDKASDEEATNHDPEKCKTPVEEESALQPADTSLSKRSLQTNSENLVQDSGSTNTCSKKSAVPQNDGCIDSHKDIPISSNGVSNFGSDEDRGLNISSPEKLKQNEQSNSNLNCTVDKNPKPRGEGNSRSSELEGSDSSDSEAMEVDVDELSQGESNSEHTEAGTEGMLDDLPRLPSDSSPVYPNLVRCVHPIDCISSKLTAPVWKKSLLREFSEQGICTIGDLAKVTQDRLDRLKVKPPKRTNVLCVLEDFERHHDSLRDSVMCELSKESPTSCVEPQADQPQYSLKDALASASDEEIVTKLAELGRLPNFCSLVIKESKPLDVAKNIASSQAILQALPVDTVAETYLSQVGKSSGRIEKNISVESLALILSRVQAGVLQDTIFPAVPSILSSVLSDSMRNYVLREFSSSEIVCHMDNEKLSQMVHPISLRIGAKEVVSKVFSKLNEEDIAKIIDKSKIEGTVRALLSNLAPHESLKFLFDYGQSILSNK